MSVFVKQGPVKNALLEAAKKVHGDKVTRVSWKAVNKIDLAIQKLVDDIVAAHNPKVKTLDGEHNIDTQVDAPEYAANEEAVEQTA